MRLTSSSGKGVGKQRSHKAPTLIPGTENANKQRVMGATGMPSTSFAGQLIYRMLCSCGHEYGSNGCDVHARKCPACQGGVAGEPLPERPPMLF